MKKIIPFKKELIFTNNILEITSISLENTLHKEKDNLITGNFIISGDYKIDNVTKNTEVFNYEIPFDINIDDKYNIENVNIEIEDFYYEIVNDKVMEVNIEVSIDKIEEKEEPNEEIRTRCIEKEDILENIKELPNIKETKKEDIFEQINIPENKEKINDKNIVEDIEETNNKNITEILKENNETYKTYKVYIVRKEDTIEQIIEKYKLKKEELEKYNIINEIKIGDKLIIPDTSNETN